VTIYENSSDDDGTTESATTGSASIGTLDTTVDAASGVSESNPRKLNVASTTGCAVGDRYLLTSATSSESEWIEVESFVANDYIICKDPLANDYASSDTLEDTSVTISVDSTWVAAKTNVSQHLDPNPRYRARWVYVFNSVTYVQASYFDLVRYKGQHTVNGLDVDRAFPGWLDSLPTYHREDQGRKILAEAYRQVKMDLYRYGKADQLLRNQEVVDNLVMYKANALVAAANVSRGANPDAAEFSIAIYDKEIQHLIAHPKVDIDKTGQGGASSPERVGSYPVWRR